MPEFIDSGEDDVALKHVEHLWVLLLDLQLVSLFDLGDEELGIADGVALMEAAAIYGELNREGGVDPAEELGVVRSAFVPLFEVAVDSIWDGSFNDFIDELTWVLRVDDFIAVAVDDFPLFVHDVVKIKDALTPGVVALFDTLLGGFYGAVEPLVLEGLTVFHAEALHHVGHALGSSKVTHQVIFKGDKELGHTGVSLA